MMACRPYVPGLSFARQPGTSLITLRFPEPEMLSEADPQKTPGSWTTVKGNNHTYMTPSIVKTVYPVGVS